MSISCHCALSLMRLIGLRSQRRNGKAHHASTFAGAAGLQAEVASVTRRRYPSIASMSAYSALE